MASETYLGFLQLWTTVPSFLLLRSGSQDHFLGRHCRLIPMNADLLYAAGNVVSNNHILVNTVRLRVRQLLLGHRPLVVAPPGAGMADIALMEIAQKKLTFAAVVEPASALPLSPVLEFPDVQVKKKAA